ncbi:hypothetical protein [Paraglaciecola sp.]|uniref:hypothetical protein n=1 Tax=Paraglaciecola sp. TaxID=1920173 RepID=UPI003EF157D6
MFKLITLLCFVLYLPFSIASEEPLILVDLAHGERSSHPKLRKLASELNVSIVEATSAITPKSLKGVSVLYLRAPNTYFEPAEQKAIVEFVKQGGALFLVIDEEERQSLDKTKVNNLLTPFSMMLTQDTPYLHNAGAVSTVSDINKQIRELPFSGGRAIVGGTPFAFQVDKNGNQGLPFAAFKSIKNGGRIVVLGEGMVTIFMGKKDAQRMSGEFRNPRKTTYWGKDSYVFMQEIFTWLIHK